MTAEIHSWLLGAAAIGSLVLRSLVLARNPRSAAGQMHAIFGIAVAWRFYCMANAAIATTSEAVEQFSRLAHIAIGMLPAITYHLHIATAGLWSTHRRALIIHYAVSTAVAFFCLTWPGLFTDPSAFSWGPYPRYTAWGLVPSVWLLIVLIEIPLLYRTLLRSSTPGTSNYRKTRALYLGNLVSPIAMVDFATVRYRIVEITPQISMVAIKNANG